MKVLQAVVICAAAALLPAAAFADDGSPVPQAIQDGSTCAGWLGVIHNNPTPQTLAPYTANLTALATVLGLMDNLSDDQAKAEYTYIQMQALLACTLYQGMTYPDALDAAAMLYQVTHP